MKLTLIIIQIFFLGFSVSGQEDIVACMKNFAFKGDSLLKAGFDPFEAMKECALNKKVPSFNFVSFNGDTISSEQLKGKIVVLNFWFIDCHPCIAEISGMNRLVKEYGNNNIEFLAITWETIKRIKENFLTKYKLDFKIIPEAMKYIEKGNGLGYPTTYILDTQGFIREVWSGGKISDDAGKIYYEKAKPVIDSLLKTL
jgi:peroxiredoxin